MNQVRTSRYLASPFLWLTIVYFVDSVLMLVNRGYYGFDGANALERIILVLSMPWIFIWNFIPASFSMFSKLPQHPHLENFVFFVLTPYLFNLIVVIVLSGFLKRHKTHHRQPNQSFNPDATSASNFHHRNAPHR